MVGGAAVSRPNQGMILAVIKAPLCVANEDQVDFRRLQDDLIQDRRQIPGLLLLQRLAGLGQLGDDPRRLRQVQVHTLMFHAQGNQQGACQSQQGRGKHQNQVHAGQLGVKRPGSLMLHGGGLLFAATG